MDSLSYVRRNVPQTELLAQLAEEAAELAQAALKLRRALDTTNPTPTRADEAQARLNEEFADVLLCAEVAGIFNIGEVSWNTLSAMDDKLFRWAQRLEAAKEREGDAR